MCRYRYRNGYRCNKWSSTYTSIYIYTDKDIDIETHAYTNTPMYTHTYTYAYIYNIYILQYLFTHILTYSRGTCYDRHVARRVEHRGATRL